MSTASVHVCGLQLAMHSTIAHDFAKVVALMLPLPVIAIGKLIGHLAPLSIYQLGAYCMAVHAVGTKRYLCFYIICMGF